MQNDYPAPNTESDYDEQERERQKDHGVPFINTSVSETEPIKSPEEMDEESVIGSMPDPESDDDVHNYGKPFAGKDED